MKARLAKYKQSACMLMVCNEFEVENARLSVNAILKINPHEDHEVAGGRETGQIVGVPRIAEPSGSQAS